MTLKLCHFWTTWAGKLCLFLNCRFFQAVFNALMVLFTYLDRALKNKRIISWSVYFFSLPWLRFTERSHVICSASPHISYIFFWCHCANCLITMNVFDTVGWRAMLENWEKFMKKRSILIKMCTITSMTSKDLSQGVWRSLLRSLLLQGHNHVSNGFWCRGILMQEYLKFGCIGLIYERIPATKNFTIF